MSAPPSPLLIWGAGGHAAVVDDIFRLCGQYVVAGFIDDVDPTPRPFLDARVLGGADALAQALELGVRHAIVAIGECEARLARARVLKTHGLTLVSARHPGAIVASSALVDPGTVIAAGAVVGVRTRLGESVIVNTRASIDHDCVLDEGVHVCPGACLAGHVRVGAGAWIGVGATIADDLAIGARSVIGAGAVVIGPIEAGVVAYGVPARAVRRVST